MGNLKWYWHRFCMWWWDVTLADRACQIASEQASKGISGKDQKGWHIWRIKICRWTSIVHWQIKWMNRKIRKLEEKLKKEGKL